MKTEALCIALMSGLLSVCGALSCGDDEPAETTAGPTTTAAGGGADMGEDIVIGAINSITGVNALTGAEQKWAQEKAAEDINAKGGIKLADGKMHKVVLKFMDDKSSDVEAAAAMEKLIKSEGLDAVRALRKAFPDRTIVADLKTMDAEPLKALPMAPRQRMPELAVEKAVKALDGVAEANVDLGKGIVTVEFVPSRATVDDIKKAIAGMPNR